LIFRIKFVVVAEPPEDQQSLNCIDIGYATVNAKQLLHDNADYVETPIDGKKNQFLSGSIYCVFFSSFSIGYE
jgi:hypothetical protein